MAFSRPSPRGKYFVEYREVGGRGGIIFYLKLILHSFFSSIICMNYEKYFVTLVDKHVNKTKYLIFYIMSSAICILTSNSHGLKHDSELHMNYTSLWTSRVWSLNLAVAVTRPCSAAGVWVHAPEWMLLLTLVVLKCKKYQWWQQLGSQKSPDKGKPVGSSAVFFS